MAAILPNIGSHSQLRSTRLSSAGQYTFIVHPCRARQQPAERRSRCAKRFVHWRRRARPEPPNGDQNGAESAPWDPHGELLKQVEERKKLHQQLVERLQRQGRSAASEPELAQVAAVPTQQPATDQELDFQQRKPVAQTQKPVAGPQIPRSQSAPAEEAQPAFREQPHAAEWPTLPIGLPVQQQPQETHQPEPAPPAQNNPPLAGENVMNVIMVGAECAPWSKTGGLGDVMGALPKALARRGHRVMAIAPRYANYAEAWETGVRRIFRIFNGEHEVGYFHGYMDGVDWVFVDHQCFHHFEHDIYGGSRTDILFRMALLCKAALEAPWHVPCGGAPYGDSNLLYIANDWHTALLPFYLQAHYRDYNQLTYARSLLVVHNVAHQGRGPMAELGNLEVPSNYTEAFRLYDPIGGEHMNIMKAGFLTAHRLVAVSHGYAWECQTQEGGWGLDGVLRDHSWKLRGIVNGIDYSEWSPMHDKFLSNDSGIHWGYRNYDFDSLKEGKAACKAALQRELGLPVEPDVPLLAFIGRLDHQKGVDLIRDSFDWLMDQGAQLVMLGSGRFDLESSLKEMESRRYHQCRGWVGFSVSMAHRLTAGADLLLMPSRFEPCGLNQLYAMAYGTVPIVHAVGGLRDTVQAFNPHENQGTGWTFEWADGENLRHAVGNAMYTYREHKESFTGVQRRGMGQDLSWDNAAHQYEEVLVAGKYQW